MILRQSLIRTWERCPAQYYASYVLGLNLGQFDPNMMYGTMIHGLVEDYHISGADKDYFPAPLIKRYTDVYAQSDYIYVESSFSWTMPLTGIEFTGTIDRIAEDGLHDLKTSRVSYSQRKVDEDIQATAYLAYWYNVTGELKPFTFDVLRKDRRANGGEFALQVITTTRTVEQLKLFELYCEQVVEDISNETEFRCLCRNQEHAIFSNVGAYV